MSLLARIHRRYQTVTQMLRFGSIEFPFTRIKEPDRVLDEACAEEDRRDKLKGQQRPGEELSLPYWAELWESAVGVGQFLAAHRASLPHRSVLDLGCGMGLAGTVAAALGWSVTLADLERAALLFARLNTEPWRARARVRRLDWRVDQLDEKFDLILGADVLYDRAQWEHLDRFWQQHLNDEGEILLGEPGRQTGEMFTDWIRDRRWSLEEFAEQVPTRQRPIRIFQLTRSAQTKSTAI
jgi:predicted nicotinamide N-methyase